MCVSTAYGAGDSIASDGDAHADFRLLAVGVFVYVRRGPDPLVADLRIQAPKECRRLLARPFNAMTFWTVARSTA